MTKKLIINADDFGSSEGINKGIIVAHRNGVVTSTSLFVEMPGTDDALKQLKENPGIGVGIHINVDKYFNIDHQKGIAGSLLDPRPSIDELKSDIKRQFDKYFSFGLSCDHLDSHHHAHLNCEIFPFICELMKEYKVPVIRLPQKYYHSYSDFEKLKNITDANGIKTVEHFIEGWYWGNLDENYKVAELMTHPGYGELWREAELAHCCQPQLKQYFADQKIGLIKFSDII